MSASEHRPRRPVTVVLAVVLVAASGLLNTALGILVLLSRYQVPDAEILTVSLLGAGIILFGLLTLAISGGIARGSRLSRILVTVYVAIVLVLHLVTIVTTDGWDWTSIVEMVLDVAVLVVMWTPPGSRYFVSRAPAPDPMAV